MFSATFEMGSGVLKQLVFFNEPYNLLKLTIILQIMGIVTKFMGIIRF